jgi:hypothetical protein
VELDTLVDLLELEAEKTSHEQEEQMKLLKQRLFL